ncbi:hypothetical protein BC940DRAFT_159604 [Gongronella butleri]|nr:hypothetical protein BC940DRAFT_159604 [Gongronella butleri]
MVKITALIVTVSSMAVSAMAQSKTCSRACKYADFADFVLKLDNLPRDLPTDLIPTSSGAIDSIISDASGAVSSFLGNPTVSSLISEYSGVAASILSSVEANNPTLSSMLHHATGDAASILSSIEANNPTLSSIVNQATAAAQIASSPASTVRPIAAGVLVIAATIGVAML